MGCGSENLVIVLGLLIDSVVLTMHFTLFDVSFRFGNQKGRKLRESYSILTPYNFFEWGGGSLRIIILRDEF